MMGETMNEERKRKTARAWPVVQMPDPVVAAEPGPRTPDSAGVTSFPRTREPEPGFGENRMMRTRKD